MKWNRWAGPNDSNCATLFLLPITNMQLGDFYSNGFVRTFLGDAELEEETEDKILVLMHPITKQGMEVLMDRKVRRNPLYLFEYDIEDYVSIVFDVPDIWKEVLQKFKLGQYSKFSQEYKTTYFPEISSVTKRESLLHKILYKKEEAYNFLETKYDIFIPRSQEAWSRPNCEKEILRYNENSNLCWNN